MTIYIPKIDQMSEDEDEDEGVFTGRLLGQ
jgi:hypothetical protein